MSTHRKALKRMTAQRLKNMTDAELSALSDTNPPDLSDFSDAELDALINDTASPALLAKVDAAPHHPSSQETP